MSNLANSTLESLSKRSFDTKKTLVNSVSSKRPQHNTSSAKEIERLKFRPRHLHRWATEETTTSPQHTTDR